MMYTTKGKINRGKSSKAGKYLTNFIEMLIPISFLLITLGFFFNLVFFKSGHDLIINTQPNNKNTLNKLEASNRAITDNYNNHIQKSYAQPSNYYNDRNSFHQVVKGTTNKIEKPLVNYMNNFALREMRESIERKERERAAKYQIERARQEAAKTNQIAEITSTIKRSSTVWEECLHQDREGYDYSNAVILCKDSKKIILPR